MITSYPEVGVSSANAIDDVASGYLDSASLYGGYLAVEIPAMGIPILWGFYASPQQSFAANVAIFEDLEGLVSRATGGVVFNHSWYAGDNLFLFCREKIES